MAWVWAYKCLGCVFYRYLDAVAMLGSGISPGKDSSSAGAPDWGLLLSTSLPAPITSCNIAPREYKMADYLPLESILAKSML